MGSGHVKIVLMEMTNFLALQSLVIVFFDISLQTASGDKEKLLPISKLYHQSSPSRFTACVTALSACARPLCENYPIEVMKILSVLLPGIDVNDIWKCTDNFILMSDLLEGIYLVDFSSPEMRKGSLTPAEEEFCNKTAMFEDFVITFTNKCLNLIQHSSREQTRHETDVMEEYLNDEEIATDAAITDTFQKILHRCSPKIFVLAFDKVRFKHTSYSYATWVVC